MLVLLILALVVSTASVAPRTPRTKPPDVNQFIESCMTSGHRVGECMARMRREA